MYSFREMRVARGFLCSRAWTSTCAGSMRSAVHKGGSDAIQTTLDPSHVFYKRAGSRFAMWEHHPRSWKHLQRSSELFGIQSCIGTFLGLTVAASFWATEQGPVQCENHDDLHDEFRACQQVIEMTTDDCPELETELKLLSFVKRYWWPTVFLLTVVLGYPYPMLFLPNSLLLIWSTKPSPASIYHWLKKRNETPEMNQSALHRIKDKINPTATLMHVVVQDCMFFCVAKVTYLTSNTTIVGALGDWWVVYSSSSRIAAPGLSLENVPNLDIIAAGIGNELRCKKEELEAEFKKATEDGLEKYKSWTEKLLPGVSWVD